MTELSRISVARRGAYLLVTATLLAGPPVSAQNAGVEEVRVTATRVGQTVEEVTEGLTIVGSKQVSEAQIQIISDALRGQTGVYVQQTTAGQGTAIVRGLKGSEVLHLVDGMRLNNALFRNAPNQYLALVDPFITDQVEVVRGPLSTLYGSDAMGGVLQVTTARPFLGGGDWQTRGRVLARFDSRTLGRIGHASVMAGTGSVSMGVALSYQDHDDLRAADRRAQSPTAYRSEAASSFVTFAPDDRQSYGLSVQYLEQPATPRYDELVAGFGQSEPASSVFLFAPNSRLFVHGEHHSTGWSAWLDELEVHVGLQKMTDDRRTRDYEADTERREANDSTLLGLTVRGAAIPGAVHALTYGIDMYFDEVRSARQEVNIVDGNVATVRPRFPDGSQLDTVDLYIQDALSASERLNMTFGARISHASVQLTGDSERPAADIDNTDLTASLGLRYVVDHQVSLLGNLGRGFRAPNIFDLGTLGARPGNRFNIANPDLGPETVWTADAGVRVATGSVDAEFFVWFSDYRDKITSVSTGETDPAGRDIVQSRNADKVALRGAELAARYRLSPALVADIGVNYVWGETEASDGGVEPADRVPPLNGRLGLRYEQDRGWIDAQVRYADAQSRLSGRDVRDPRIDPTGTAGWGIVDLRTGTRVGDLFDVTFAINNLTDRGYREHGSGLDGAGRAVILTLEGRF